jgi:hypothetical protein
MLRLRPACGGAADVAVVLGLLAEETSGEGGCYQGETGAATAET